MKILSYSLFCFIFCFLGLCDEEEDNCKKLDKEITVKIYSEIRDETGSIRACENPYSVEFYKDHCGGGLSGTMSYTHHGCYDYKDESFEFRLVQKQSIGIWDITFRYEEDMLYVSIVDPNAVIKKGAISGKRIYELTNGGSSNVIIFGTLYNNDIITIDFFTR